VRATPFPRERQDLPPPPRNDHPHNFALGNNARDLLGSLFFPSFFFSLSSLNAPSHYFPFFTGHSSKLVFFPLSLWRFEKKESWLAVPFSPPLGPHGLFRARLADSLSDTPLECDSKSFSPSFPLNRVRPFFGEGLPRTQRLPPVNFSLVIPPPPSTCGDFSTL